MRFPQPCCPVPVCAKSCQASRRLSTCPHGLARVSTPRSPPARPTSAWQTRPSGCWLLARPLSSTRPSPPGSSVSCCAPLGRGPLPSGAQQLTLLPGGEGRVDDNGLAKSQQPLGLVCQALVGPAGGLRGVDTLAKPCGHVLSRRDARQLFAHTVTGQHGCGNRIAQTLSKGGLA